MQKNKELLEMKKKLEDMKNNSSKIEAARKIVRETQSQMKDYVNVRKNKNKTMASKEIRPDEEEYKKMDAKDKIRVKQRVINYTLNVFENFDLAKIIEFWKSKIL